MQSPRVNCHSPQNSASISAKVEHKNRLTGVAGRKIPMEIVNLVGNLVGKKIGDEMRAIG